MQLAVKQDYYDVDRLSRSSLCDLKVSNYYFWCKHIAKTVDFDSSAMRFGRTFHCALLEPKEFKKLFAVAPNVDRRTKLGKEEYQLFIDNVGNKEIIDNKDNDLINDLIMQIGMYTPAKKLINVCEFKEKEFYYDYQGYSFKSKLDCVSVANNIVVDVKTVNNSKNSTQTANDVLKYDYAEQVFLYSYAFEQQYGKRPIFLFINVSKSAPYEISIYDSSCFYEYGKMIIDRLLDQYNLCVKKWGIDPSTPWRDDSINELQLPKWAENELLDYQIEQEQVND